MSKNGRMTGAMAIQDPSITGPLNPRTCFGKPDQELVSADDMLLMHVYKRQGKLVMLNAETGEFLNEVNIPVAKDGRQKVLEGARDGSFEDKVRDDKARDALTPVYLLNREDDVWMQMHASLKRSALEAFCHSILELEVKVGHLSHQAPEDIKELYIEGHEDFEGPGGKIPMFSAKFVFKDGSEFDVESNFVGPGLPMDVVKESVIRHTRHLFENNLDEAPAASFN